MLRGRSCLPGLSIAWEAGYPERRVWKLLVSVEIQVVNGMTQILDRLDEHVFSVCRQGPQVAGIGGEYGPSWFRERHDERIDG